jgi:hypothetical protein
VVADLVADLVVDVGRDVDGVADVQGAHRRVDPGQQDQ